MSVVKRRLFPALLCLFLAVSLLPGAWAQETGFDGGSGTAEDPYRISTAQQLFYLGERVNAGDPELSCAHYLLTADINLEEELFPPIGISPETPFRGTFDGGGQIIYNFSYDNDELRESISKGYLTGQGDWDPVYMGLFGVLEGGTVKNLTVDGYVSGYVVGGLVGWNNGGTVANCIVTCTPAAWNINGKPSSAGGIAGRNDGQILNCCFAGPLTGALSGIGSEGIAVNCFSLGTFHDILSGQTGDAIFLDGSGTEAARLERSSFEGTDGESAIAAEWSARLNAWTDDLNAWVDDQPEGDYDHWTPVPGAYPLMGDHLIRFEIETGAYLPWGETGDFVPLEGDRTGGKICSPYEFSAGLSELRPNFLPALDGVSRTVFFEAYEGYRICDVLVDGVSVGPVESYTFPAVTEDHTILVRFVEEGSMEHFVPSLPYSGYKDVDEGAWYGTEHEGTVSMATRLGLFAGVGEGRFSPDAQLTLGEAVKLAAVMRDTYRNEGYPFDQSAGAHWYDTYVDYAVSAGILEAGEFEDFDRPASRSEMVHLFYHALPSEEYGTISSLQPADLTPDDPYYFDVSLLYYAGVLKGSDNEGTFRGEDTITRVEAAAIAVRVALPSQRIADPLV